jgi:hypothetical protein
MVRRETTLLHFIWTLTLGQLINVVELGWMYALEKVKLVVGTFQWHI